jgi:hypothetical protein
MTDSNGSNNSSGQALDYWAGWLGTAGPRLAATYAAQPLPALVEAALDELTAAGKAFTAYDVTRVLRALFPHRALPHYDRPTLPGVQQEVHRQMARYLSQGGYTARTVRANGADPAQLYMPSARRRRNRGWLTILAPFNSSNSASVAPSDAWVIRDGSS